MDSRMYRTRACITRFGLMSLSSRKACRAHQDSPMKIRFVRIWTNASEPVPSEDIILLRPPRIKMYYFILT